MRNTYRIENEEIIIGFALPVFINNLNYHLTEIQIFKDGKIDCWGLVDFDTFIHKVRSGWIQTSVPDGETIYAFPLGNFVINKFYQRRTGEELIKEVSDIIEELNDRPTTSIFCAQAFRNYQDNPTDENKKKLRTLYEEVPEHNRQFILGDMDVDDIPIRVVLYGESEFDKTHKGKIQRQYIKDHYLRKTQ
jgi:hypothetical protein